MAVSTACISIFPPLVGKLQPRFLTAEGSLRVYIYFFSHPSRPISLFALLKAAQRTKNAPNQLGAVT